MADRNVTMPYNYPGFPVRKFVGNEKNYTCEDMQWGNPHEFTTRSNLWSAASRGGSWVEVGAHIGTTTVLAAGFFSRGFAYEPSTENYNYLCRNLEMNSMKHVTAFHAAVSDKPGKQTLYLFPERDNACHSLCRNVVYNLHGSEEVEVKTLDGLDVNDCTYLHIDAEGNDVLVLSGGKNFLQKQTKKPIISIEFAPRLWATNGVDVQTFLNLANEFKYDLFIDAGNNHALMNGAILTEIFHTWKGRNYGWLDVFMIPQGEFGAMFPR